MNTSVVWFKRDLRVHDHRPLFEAGNFDQVIYLYGFETEVMESREYDASHHGFIEESLSQLHGLLKKQGGGLTVKIGKFPQILSDLYQQLGFKHLFSHQETGNMRTYQRDIRVANWCRSEGVSWNEYPQFGVTRPQKEGGDWSSLWSKFMNRREIVPRRLPHNPLENYPQTIPLDQTDTKTRIQRGGELRSIKTLESFLNSRGEHYQKSMSTPVLAGNACSRLSPHLAFGNISLRRVYQRTRDQQAFVRHHRLPNWGVSLASFQKRLNWHCHFIQKLEDAPQIEFDNFDFEYDGLRSSFNEHYFSLWSKGETGYPLIDACMRCLLHTGWINFRMRAMLASFSANHLWLHWRKPAVFLARHFLDFEPGIHYCQFQMHAGTAGINSMRIYSPIKQVKDQDPNGEFIKKWVPELASVPSEFLAEPHKMTIFDQMAYNCKIGRDYPKPVVDHEKAYKSAKEKLFGLNKKLVVQT